MSFEARTGGLLRSGTFALVLLATPFSSRAADTNRALDLARQMNEAFVAVAEKVSPAVVVIDVAQRETSIDPSAGHPWFNLLPEPWKERLQQEQQQRKDRRERSNEEGPDFDGEGSGMILNKNGDVLTNHHVVEGAEKLRIRLRDGRQFEAEVKGVDAEADLAVLRIKDPPPDLPVVTFGDSDRVRVGEFAIAIGAPYRLDYSVSFGHISAKGRRDIIGGRFDQNFLQTDANINPGNSGGPLVDIEGRVIGINAMIRGLNSGIGFAIPSNLAKEITDRLIEDGRFVRAWLGLGIAALRDTEKIGKLVPDLRDGVVITAIMPNGPASRAEPDLQPADVITSVDGRAVANPAELQAVVSRKRPGSTVVLDVRRSETSLKVRVSPEPLPDAEERYAMQFRRGHRPKAPDFHGLSVAPLPDDSTRPPEVESGVVVEEVNPGSAAAEQDLHPGDVITELNHQSVESPKQFQDLLKEANLSKGILLRVFRDGQESFRVLKPAKE